MLEAMCDARSQRAEIAALHGFDGGKALELADIGLIVPSYGYGVVEDAHLIINHIQVVCFRARLP